MNGRIHRRHAAPKSKRLQQFPCCERAQRGIKTSAVDSIQLFAASGANGRKAGFQEIHTACPLITVLRQIQKLPLADEQKNS